MFILYGVAIFQFSVVSKNNAQHFHLQLPAHPAIFLFPLCVLCALRALCINSHFLSLFLIFIFCLYALAADPPISSSSSPNRKPPPSLSPSSPGPPPPPCSTLHPKSPKRA